MPRRKRAEGTRAPNGASSIYLGKDGYWHGRVTMGTLDDGTPDRRHVQRKTEGEVIEAVRELERQRDSGRVRKPGRKWTVEKWLHHWVENIAAPSVRPNTMTGYRASVYKHLIPGVGAHRLDKLQPEHLERLYARLQDWRHGCPDNDRCRKRPGNVCRQRQPGLKPATVHLAHRTIRVALNEAVRRKHITENPAAIAKPPRVEEEEVIPFTVEEARRILDAAVSVRNGVRFVVALTLGLRRGEALGLRWSDLAVKWRHGCPKGSPCRRLRTPKECPVRRGSGTLAIRRAVHCYPWKHGCSEAKPCGRKNGANCPERHSGGIVVADVKSRAGRRTVGLPHPLIEALEKHRERQDAERRHAGDLWEEGGWIFTNRFGRPVHPTVDHESWKNLLRKAQVRNARLHDARHTAATMLLVLKVPPRAIMDIMGWSEAAMLQRYVHIPNELVEEIAAKVGDLMWLTPDQDEEADDGMELMAEQRQAVRQLLNTLPEAWRRRLAELFPDEGDDGPAGALVSA
ncbi:site-specific integrase [Longimycelium tulufanense]|uniref:Site-specific integrase n=1 Tax=Longimycelium tulufanense TaxID=907463 RepID=A0A8J3FWY6_9PSEU|nr:tyrosine-type recombinase/integrase [Longimycelium tulufanense]GGM81595.1 site-specific integrase [Longimycelium tulufanense]